MAGNTEILIFLCMLIGCSQVFPFRDVSNDDVGRPERERRSAILAVIDVTPPVCRVLNESLYCPLSCGNATWEVSYIMTDGSGSGINHPSIITTGSGELNITLDITTDENGYNATLVTYSGSCCLSDVEINVIDKAGNIGKCPFNMHYPSTPTPIPMTTSSSPITTITIGSSLIWVALKSVMF